MSATGLDVFDKTLQTTNIWLNEINERIGPDRQVAWKVLSTVLHKLRDRLPMPLAAHLGAQLPLLVRGAYYDQFEPRKLPMSCDYEEFVAEVDEWLTDTKPVAAEAAIAAVFALLSRHISAGQIAKIQDALPEELCVLWRNSEKTLGQKTLEKKSGSRPSSSAPRTQITSTQANGPEQPMQVRDLMTHDVATISPDHTLRKAALLMAKLDVGMLPVGENDRLVGIITDRDMAV